MTGTETESAAPGEHGRVAVIGSGFAGIGISIRSHVRDGRIA